MYLLFLTSSSCPICFCCYFIIMAHSDNSKNAHINNKFLCLNPLSPNMQPLRS